MIGISEEIKSDLFDIALRVKEIDPAYYLMFNYKTKKFEVHNSGQNGSSLALVLPYTRLDERAILHIRRTRVERIDKLLKELEY